MRTFGCCGHQVWWLVLVLVLCGLPVSEAVAGKNLEGVRTIDILTVNDVHGALLATGKNPGLAKTYGVIQSLRSENPQGTLLVGGGDYFQGSVESNLTGGENTLVVLNAMGFQAMAVGNHEFDWGLERLRQLAGQAEFPFLAANIRQRSTGETLPFLPPSRLLEVGGVKIGVLGLTTQETPIKTHPRNVQELLFTDPAAEARREVEELRAKGAELVVVIAHLGSEQDPQTGALAGEGLALLQQVEGIDVLVTGHTHQVVAGRWRETVVVQAGNYGQNVGHVRLQVDPVTHQVLAQQVEVLPVAVHATAADTELAELVQLAVQEAEIKKCTPVAELSMDLPHDRWQLTLLGAYVADSLRQATGAEVAFVNGGGIRTGLMQGTVTLGQTFGALPFDNTVVTLQLSGRKIREVLEYGLFNAQVGTIQFSGITVQYDGGRMPGERVREIRLADGSLLRDGADYRVATNDFLFSGGDGFTQFAAGSGVKDTQMTMREIVQDGLLRNGSRLSPLQVNLQRLQLLGKSAASAA